jgi:hypothetical protein
MQTFQRDTREGNDKCIYLCRKISGTEKEELMGGQIKMYFVETSCEGGGGWTWFNLLRIGSKSVLFWKQEWNFDFLKEMKQLPSKLFYSVIRLPVVASFSLFNLQPDDPKISVSISRHKLQVADTVMPIIDKIQAQKFLRTRPPQTLKQLSGTLGHMYVWPLQMMDLIVSSRWSVCLVAYLATYVKFTSWL